jgi:hypothetical protein
VVIIFIRSVFKYHGSAGFLLGVLLGSCYFLSKCLRLAVIFNFKSNKFNSLASKYYWEIPRSGYILGTFRLNPGLDDVSFMSSCTVTPCWCGWNTTVYPLSANTRTLINAFGFNPGRTCAVRAP